MKYTLLPINYKILVLKAFITVIKYDYKLSNTITKNGAPVIAVVSLFTEILEKVSSGKVIKKNVDLISLKI